MPTIQSPNADLDHRPLHTQTQITKQLCLGSTHTDEVLFPTELLGLGDIVIVAIINLFYTWAMYQLRRGFE